MPYLRGDRLGDAGFWFWAGAMCLVIATPYIGIDHDARLYMVGALHFLDPGRYARDIWFFDGSQDRWSLFSPLLAQFVSLFDIEGGAMVATLCQGGLFLVSAYGFSRATLRQPASLLLFLLLLVYPICYSPKGMLFVREGFVSARMVGIAFSLLGLAACLKGRTVAGALWHGLAMSIHPIMAVGPAAVSLLLRMPVRGQVFVSLLGSLALGGAFWAGAAGGLAIMDADWWAYVDLAALVSIGDWIAASASHWLSLFALLIVAGRHGNRGLRPFYQLVVLVSAVAVLVSVLAGLYLQVAILLQAQLWRTLWLAYAAGLVALVDLGCRHLVRRHASNREACLLLAALGLVFPSWGGLLLAVLTLVHRVAPSSFSKLLAELRARRLVVLIVSAVLISMALPGYFLDWALASGSVNVPDPMIDTLLGFLRTGGYGLMAVLVWLFGRGLLARSPWLATLMLVPLTVTALMSWDARPAEKRALEDRYALSGARSRFFGLIPRGSVVFWNRAAERVWFELGTAGYAGTLHSTGMVFSRERTRLLSVRLIGVALASRNREQLDAAIASGAVIESLLRRDSSAEAPIDPFLLAAYESLSSMTPFGLRTLCRDRQLDYVVDTLFVPDVVAIPVHEEILGRRHLYFVYPCAAFAGQRH